MKTTKRENVRRERDKLYNRDDLWTTGRNDKEITALYAPVQRAGYGLTKVQMCM